jgi:putative transposase
MKRKNFTEEQIVKALKRAQQGETPKVICRELGIHEQTFYNWKKKYGGMEVSDVIELKRLNDENNRLKKLVAELSLDVVMLKDINSRKW